MAITEFKPLSFNFFKRNFLPQTQADLNTFSWLCSQVDLDPKSPEYICHGCDVPCSRKPTLKNPMASLDLSNPKLIALVRAFNPENPNKNFPCGALPKISREIHRIR